MRERKTEHGLDVGDGALSVLQWGRSDEGAEDERPWRLGGSTGRRGFNGAAPMMERKTRMTC